MSRSFVPFLLAVLAAVAGAGCFDVRTVYPGPYVIDDFDDGDLFPADPDFNMPWSCSPLNAADLTKRPQCALDLGYKSESSLRMFAEVDDAADLQMNYPGASMAALATGGALDFSGYKEIVFSAKVESGVPPLPDGSQLTVEFGCMTTPTDNGIQTDQLRVSQSAAYKASWQTVALEMRNFGSPTFDSTHFVGGPAACLARVDSVRFSIIAKLADGASTQFTVNLDSVFLQ